MSVSLPAGGENDGPASEVLEELRQRANALAREMVVAGRDTDVFPQACRAAAVPHPDR
ncbi:hypothetical protein [Streptomyces sp. G-G2]|uniref:hypothetical protein n=1 Tax=Streptomyces sp. G-G2 TaxID=3046201 RepID=UPI0032D90C4F